MKKTYIGISRDHSGSMYRIARAAARDYNDNVASIREAEQDGQETYLSVVSQGLRSGVRREVTLEDIRRVREMQESEYLTDGQTPLFDSVGELIEQFEAVKFGSEDDVSFLVMAITDGEENFSRRWTARRLKQKMDELTATDRWTFVFRVPRGYKQTLIRTFGMPEDNVLEWEATDQGVQQASVTTRQAFTKFMGERTRGATSTRSFYTVSDLSKVSTSDLKVNLQDISREVQIQSTMRDEEVIREFCEKRFGRPFLKGAAFYELVKTEKKVQDYKLIVIRDRNTGAVYAGPAARQMLGLPQYGEVKLVPGNHNGYEVYIQSTSVNRKLPGGTKVLWWPKVGVEYIEGKSAPWGR